MKNTVLGLRKRAIFQTAVFLHILLMQATIGYTQVRIPRLVSDGMVLQRGVPIRIWGWAGIGEDVSVSFDGTSAKTQATSDGHWSVLLEPRKPGGPYNLDIDGINHIEIRNVMVGDVWVCSGQSNMELTMDRVKEKYADIIAHSENKEIRQFLIPLRYDFHTPYDNVPVGRWEAANPSSVLSFSAVAYFFALEVYNQYHVPVGLINNAVGGAPAEAWLSADALKEFPKAEATEARFASDTYRDSITAADKAAAAKWYTEVYNQDKGLHDEKPWYDPSYDASGWESMKVPGLWADQGGPKENGVVWFRKEIDIPAAMAGQAAKLRLGTVVDQDSVYVNGQFAGTTAYKYPPRRYDLPAGMLRPGKNTIVVRVINSYGGGGFIPDLPYMLTGGGDTIDLKGSWKYRVGMTQGPMAIATFFEWQPGSLYNTMLAPIANYTVKGILWYQGESNISRAAEYRQLFPALIFDWRRTWRQVALPFIYVQLPNYGPVKDQPAESQWAELREAQRHALSQPQTAMAVTIDLGESNDLHPSNKQDVAKRLFLAAEHAAYEKANIMYSGPLFHSIHIRHGKAHLSFDEAESGLIVRGGGELHGFEIAGPDEHFVWAQAAIEGKTVVVWSDKVPHPIAVRYAWADNPVEANLANRDILFNDGLPASAFEAIKVQK